MKGTKRKVLSQPVKGLKHPLKNTELAPERIIKEIPMLFSTVMVKALGKDLKSETRRTSGLNEINEYPDALKFIKSYVVEKQAGSFLMFMFETMDGYHYLIKCPFGQKGDVIWVKETCKRFPELNKMPEGYGYKADIDECGQVPVGSGEDLVCRTWDKTYLKTISSMFMPKKSARTWLELTENPSVQRLQDITLMGAAREGVGNKKEYHLLWETINGAGSWEKNPWVWVIKFKKVSKPV